MVKKGKSRGNPLAELRFISSLSLDESIALLQAICDKDKRVTVKITENTPNEISCMMIYKTNIFYQNPSIMIALRRWNHTETKVEANGSVARTDEGELLSFRERDAILQLVVDAFTSNGETHPL